MRWSLALICVLFACVSFAGAGADADQASDGRVFMYRFLLATANTERELAPITEHMHSDDGVRIAAVFDVAAEVLRQRFDDPTYPDANKQRLLRALRSSGWARYRTVVAPIARSKVSKPVREAAENYLGTVRREKDSDAYVPGSIDLAALRNEVWNLALAAKPTSAQAEHLSKFPGGSLDALFKWAGTPHQILSGQTRVTDGLLIDVRVQRVFFYYRGVGRVTYGYNSGKGWLFQAVVADPLAFEDEFQYREAADVVPDQPTLAMIQLASGYTSAIKRAVQVYHNQASVPLEFLDTAAEILVSTHQSATDPVRIDTYAWICRLLTHHGGPRYQNVLARVARETTDAKLKRFAQLPLDPPSTAVKESYEPGTISLQAQRAKYPSLYPESTFTSGQL